ncbi:hypothetical protein RMR10_001890 [Agrobacterium rosae]|uniref:hypothetical protein n=1 Tax=Agrobacterium rosae TaxID=1972867 RepID=UPI002A1367D3|nr:hypothetical protein [Agrobacterium rosae]MDX8314379.1 hypothetical protein [Agrobacterium rosae]
MSGALAKYLKDFSQFVPPPEAPSVFEPETSVSSFESAWLPEPEIAIDLDEEKRKAFAEGEEAGKREQILGQEAELEALRALHSKELEAMQTRYEDEIATHLATSVISMKQAIAGNVEAACFRLFALVMERELAKTTAADISAEITREIEGGYAGTIKITGPEHLLSKIRDDLGPVDNQVDYDESDDIDIRVQLDSSVLMTRLAEFFQNARGLADE